jgi:predicted Zn-dependent peptidase
MSPKPLRLLPLLLLPLLVPAQNLGEFEKRVHEFSLANGMKFIVLERHEAPVVAFNMFADVGAVDDPAGQSSMAHMFEHMIGKGTPTVGTKNWAAEQKALERVEMMYDRLEQERRKGSRVDKDRLAQLEAEFKDAVESANTYVE